MSQQKWEEIVVSNKIVGHISAGVYRSPAGALKELVSNAFDANATKVTITTNWPSFDIITCRDNGHGILPEEFKRIMQGGIGDSKKRTDENNEITPEFGRPVIGWLGIGMLGIAQLCHEFQVTSHHNESKTAFRAIIKLSDFLKEKIGGIEPESLEETDIEVGQFLIEEIQFDEKKVGAYIVASDVRFAFIRKFREKTNNNTLLVPLPSKFSAFIERIKKENSVKKLGDYWQMVWDLAISSPVPYMEEPFSWERIRIDSEFQSKLVNLKKTLKSYNFSVVVDGLSLKKPVVFPSPTIRRDGENMTGQIFGIDEEFNVYNQRLKLFGYVYLQDGQAIEPIELRGLLLRIRNIAIGTYDSTFLKYPIIQGPRTNWLSGEIYITDGLERALNIDRDSFNEMHEHFVKLQKAIHDLLRRVFSEAGKRVSERSRIKNEKVQKARRDKLEGFLKNKLGGDFELLEMNQLEVPLSIDIDSKKIILDPQKKMWPRARAKKEFAELAMTAYEMSMLVPEKERRKRFYEILNDLLNL